MRFKVQTVGMKIYSNLSHSDGYFPAKGLKLHYSCYDVQSSTKGCHTKPCRINSNFKPLPEVSDDTLRKTIKLQ